MFHTSLLFVFERILFSLVGKEDKGTWKKCQAIQGVFVRNILFLGIKRWIVKWAEGLSQSHKVTEGREDRGRGLGPGVGEIYELRLRGDIESYRKYRRQMGLSMIVGRFKMNVCSEINILRSTQGGSIWQRSFYDHIIRDERSLIISGNIF